MKRIYLVVNEDRQTILAFSSRKKANDFMSSYNGFEQLKIIEGPIY